MVVRLRLSRGWSGQRESRKRSPGLLAIAALLQPAAVMAGVLAFWRFGADLQWTSEFAISSGVLSHWQAWVGIFLMVEALAYGLNQAGRAAVAPPAPAGAAGGTPQPLVKSGS